MRKMVLKLPTQIPETLVKYAYFVHRQKREQSYTLCIASSTHNIKHIGQINMGILGAIRIAARGVLQ